MTTPCEDQPKHVWSVLALKEHFERILAEYREAASTALTLRSQELDRRLDLLNNHAERVDEVLERCMPRTEWDIHHTQLKDKVSELEKFKLIIDTKASQSSLNWSNALTIITLIIALIALMHEFTSK